MKVKALVTQSCPTLCDPMDCSPSGSSIPRIYCSGLTFPPPGGFRDPWIEPSQHKRHPEFLVVTRESRCNSRKSTWLPRHRKMKPFPATAPQEKSHVRNWRSKGPSTSKTFSHKAPGQPEGQLVVGMDQRSPPPVDAPSCSIHSPPYTPLGLLCLLTTSREEVAEQCGGSENGHWAWDPGPVLGGPGLPP